MRRHLVTKGSFYERLADHGHEIVADSDFAHCYSPDRGRPSIPPSVMMRTVLCATHDRTSDAETSRRSRVDADWKAAMGVDDEFTGIGATTLSLFRARLVLHDAERAVFERTVERAVERGVLRGKVTAIIDSSPVAGAGAVADTYELVRGFIAKLARAAGGLDPDLARRVEPLCGGKPDIDWDDPEARRDHLQELVAVGRALLAAVEGNGDPAVTEPAALLAAVVAQDVEQGPEDPDDPRPRIRRGVAPDRIVSHSDPEMRHGRKSASRRFDGHKMHVMTDEASELVLAVDVGPGNAADADAAVPLVEAAGAIDGVEGETVLADMAYSDGDTRVAMEEAGVDVVAKVPPVRNAGRFAKTDFAIDTDARTVTCPAGVTSTEARPARDHKGRPSTQFVFPAATCAACPLRDRCVGGAGPRTVSVGMHEARMAKARAAQEDPAVKSLLRQRAKVERKIAHLQHLGMRQARYRGKRKTQLQATLAAVVANFKRLAVLGAFDGAVGVGCAA